MAAGYELSGIVAAMELKDELKSWTDTGKTHTDWEAGFLQLTSKPSIGHVMDEMSSLNVRKKVLKVLEIPARLAAEGQCAVTLFLASREDRATERRVALAWNKRIDESYTKTINIVQGLFSEASNAATCVGAALKACGGKPAIKFRGVWLLATSYEPSGIVAAMELKDELKSWTDTGKTHTDWEAGFLQLTSKPSIGHIMDEVSSLNVRKKVLKVLEIPAELAAEGQCAVTLFLASREDRATERRVALAMNKRIDESYTKAINIVQGLFSEASNAATCVGAALKACEGKPAIKFRGVMEALAAGYEPSGIVAAMELKDELTSWTDTGKTHTDWEAGFLQLTSKPSIGHIMDEMSSLNVRKKVLKVLEIPAGLAAEGQCAVTLFLASREDRATERRVALAMNKRIDESYTKAINIVQGLFSEASNAATCVGAALKACEGKPAIKFRGVMEALAAG